MKARNLILAMLILFAASCSMTQEYSFNKDYSGTVKNTLDFSSLKMFMGMGGDSAQTFSADTLSQSFAESMTALKSIPGVSNVKMEWQNDSNELVLSYEFADIETLNKSMATDNTMGNDEAHASFARKGKKITYTLPTPGSEEIEGSEDMEGMGEMFKLNLIMNFDNTIKKANSDGLKIKTEEKSVTTEMTLGEYMDSKSNKTIEIKVK